MQTRSNIQLLQEQLAFKSNFKDAIINLMERWNIKDNVFAFDNNSLSEVSQGYFEITGEYDNLNEAISNMAPNQGIRIMNNSKFYTGNRMQFISQCNDISKVIDLTVMDSLY